MLYFPLVSCVSLPGSGTGSVYSEEGIASWYGEPFHGRLTANGERYDMNAFTAAHKSLPFNTIVKVENLDNGKSVEVRITDRGPFVGERIIDLSKAAATVIGMIDAGIAHVRITAASLGADAAVGSAGNTGNGSGQFRIQVGSYKDRMNAAGIEARLKAAGFKGIVIETSGDVHRVCIGKLSEAEIEPVKAKLAGEGFVDVLVREY